MALKAPKAPIAIDDPKLHFYLVSAVTEYDRREMRKKYHNIWALSHYLAGVTAVEEAIKGGTPLRVAIVSHFLGRLATAVLKAVGLPALTRDEARGF